MCARNSHPPSGRRRATLLPLAALHVAVAGWIALAAPATADARKPAAERSARSSVGATIQIDPQQGHYVQVTLEDKAPRGKSTLLAMPAWTPGSYKIRDFARHVWDLRAVDEKGRELTVVRTDKQTWRVEHQGAPYRVRYRVYCDELTVRTNYAQDDFALISPSATVLYLPEERDRPYELHVATPQSWTHRVVLRKDASSYRARRYDQLADAPILAGASLTTRSFRVGETTVDYVVQVPAGTLVDVDRLARDAEEIVTAFTKIMGPLPNPEYAFLVVVDDVGGGGLEHANSTALIMRPRSLTDDSGYRGAARLAAHEFFHLWNVKRIRDRELFPFAYDGEVYPELLWFHEGVTETMESRAVLSAGMNDAEGYLRDLARSYGEYRRRAGSDKESLVQISRDAWIKQYQPASSHRNETISYYEKGMLAGVALDLELRIKSGGKGSLEGLFRRIWSHRGEAIPRLPRASFGVGPAARDARQTRRATNKNLPGVDADEVWLTTERLVALASEEAGVDMSDFFARYISGTEPLPIPQQLEQLGIEVKTLPAKHAWSGIMGTGREISAVEAGSPAVDAGLLPLDRPIALDGREVTDVADLVRGLEAAPAGTEHVVTYFRRQVLRTAKITVQQGIPEYSFLRKQDDTTTDQEKLRSGWLPEDASAASR